MKKENLFFLLILILIFLFCFLVNSRSTSVSGSAFSFLKASEVDLLHPMSKEKISDLYLNSNNFLSVFVNLDEGREVTELYERPASKGSGVIVTWAVQSADGQRLQKKQDYAASRFADFGCK